ncbi:hypothetical protein [Hyphomicrobium sp. LHD-15]|uniref:hypothetical protein n=1 Tax=Hyphomicrobium sp. LHD-15 TaxID=3072142 RepID=UPI00280EED8F|nr:hypothetical protein [Hyphomicrobium sp. LHD-15]MDQ8700216.1 hypothetical protein [Hyphomicrobium sp. LHD-15]
MNFTEIANELVELQRIDSPVFAQLSTAEPGAPGVDGLEEEHAGHCQRGEELSDIASVAELAPGQEQQYVVFLEATAATLRDVADAEGFDHPEVKRLHEGLRNLGAFLCRQNGVRRESFGLCLDGLELSDELAKNERVQTPTAKPKTNSIDQYLELRAAHPGAILMYRMGGFYECFFDDAVTVSAALGIVLNTRGKHNGQAIPISGVPCHSIEYYATKLENLGHKVLLCFHRDEDGGMDVERALLEPAVKVEAAE